MQVNLPTPKRYGEFMSHAKSEPLSVRELAQDDEQAFLNSLNDWSLEDRSWMTFDWKPGMSHQEHLKILENQRNGVNLPAHLVACTMLYGFVGQEIIGRVHLRHELNQNLLERGGHMGYAVSKKFRSNGYGLALAKAGLEYLKSKLLVKDVLITCAKDNQASIHIIENLGGKLENIIDDKDGVATCRYWV